ncbi:MAG: hypothetical protein CMH38_03490 [Microbacterium sp.]|uniref:hypothetical protein n=1 Tax=Microbacterium sp. TaxID=51671 RepID=UPI000C4DB41B|nr:hypothetical protein [Microbacterium sp.]MAY48819.1 hypothetical protein [Microbacterium sp.]MAY48901.1 hypothetical protein [Microbacterium sp.]MAY48982.1 hypothetical protein [Microbacterium sp.]|tara:strand:- start:51356 stop:51757 length:402 start_codon:yes stop_codon:yes gene_type:complete
MNDHSGPARNTELLQRVMQHIDDHPEQHNQAVWLRHDCGTAACFAGWAALLSDELVEVQDVEVDGMFYDRAGVMHATSGAAVKVLGVTGEESDVLFDATNSRDMLRLMVKDLVNGDTLLDCDHYRGEAEGGTR